MHPLSATDRSIRAFIRFTDVENRGAIANICLAAAMHARNAKPGYWVALTGFYTTLAGEAVAEFFLGCGAYSALNEVVLRIESHLEVNARNSRKVTLLSQETWEKCAR